MSLINKMLQDLDSRGTESVGTGAMYAQIRSVPTTGKHRPALWLWLPVAVVLLIAVALWLRASQSGKSGEATAQPVKTSLLDLKLSANLSVDQLPAQALSPQYRQNETVSNTVSNNAAAASATPIVPALKAEQAVEDKPRARNANALAAELPEKPETKSPAASAPVVVMPQERSLKNPENALDAASVSLNKQVNVLTVQQRAENAYRTAVRSIQQGRPAEAIGELEQALQLEPQHVAARQTLVGLLIDAKRQDEGVRRLQEGLKLDATQSGLAMILARLQVEKGELRNALETLRHTLPYSSNRMDYQAFLAALLQRDKRHKEAIEHYNQALLKNPQNGVWWMGLGISLQSENRLREALDAFNQAKNSNSLTPELQVFVEQKLEQLKLSM